MENYREISRVSIFVESVYINVLEDPVGLLNTVYFPIWRELVQIFKS